MEADLFHVNVTCWYGFVSTFDTWILKMINARIKKKKQTNILHHDNIRWTQVPEVVWHTPLKSTATVARILLDSYVYHGLVRFHNHPLISDPIGKIILLLSRNKANVYPVILFYLKFIYWFACDYCNGMILQR